MTIYKMFLHDFGNLASQLIQVSEDKESLDKMTESINQLLSLGGYSTNLVAEVYEAQELYIEEECPF